MSLPRFQVGNETRALVSCRWCAQQFIASATAIEPCPRCGTGSGNAICQVCGVVFVEKRSGAGGRRAIYCTNRCRVRGHREKHRQAERNETRAP